MPTVSFEELSNFEVALLVFATFCAVFFAE
jgi:hypothetical protein